MKRTSARSSKHFGFKCTMTIKIFIARIKTIRKELLREVQSILISNALWQWRQIIARIKTLYKINDLTEYLNCESSLRPENYKTILILNVLWQWKCSLLE